MRSSSPPTPSGCIAAEPRASRVTHLAEREVSGRSARRRLVVTSARVEALAAGESFDIRNGLTWTNDREGTSRDAGPPRGCEARSAGTDGPTRGGPLTQGTRRERDKGPGESARRAPLRGGVSEGDDEHARVRCWPSSQPPTWSYRSCSQMWSCRRRRRQKTCRPYR